ncbi:DUF5131 family protein [Magnetospirillum sp. 15-1]|uniref:DUF5131 family protein n=1 Tax=Magnetospirillum sp. 15-1 TaxID=1979370 RepID=UPI000BBBF155|nr:DUF5131 family protein [Magnetospirillum sp. 15-1]
MANPTTEIAWATGTCNPFKGCSKISPECANCYMTGWAYRHQQMGTPGYEDTVKGEKGKRIPTGKIGVVNKEIDALRTVKTERLFVNSMSDTFHDNVDDATIRRVFEAMDANKTGTNFLICTKRSERMAEMSATLPIPRSVWIGVTCGCNKSLHRLDDLRKVRAAVRFVSVEPLLEPIDLTPWLADGTLQWVIVGGESGKGWRKMEKAWAEAILRQCQQYGVPFFLKQWSAFKPKQDVEYPPTIDGHVWHQYPGHDDDQPVPPSDPTGTDRPDKDPKRVAAAKKAWETMRARKEVLSPPPPQEKTADEWAKVWLLGPNDPLPDTHFEKAATQLIDYFRHGGIADTDDLRSVWTALGDYFDIRPVRPSRPPPVGDRTKTVDVVDPFGEVIAVPWEYHHSEFAGVDYPYSRHVSWFEREHGRIVIDRLVARMVVEESQSERKYLHRQIAEINRYLRHRPKIQRQKWCQFEYEEPWTIDPNEVKAILERETRGLFHVTVGFIGHYSIRPSFWISVKGDVVMISLRQFIRGLDGRKIAVKPKERSAQPPEINS